MPSTGKPHRKISGSYCGASWSFTEFGPPEMIIALQEKKKRVFQNRFYQENLYSQINCETRT